MSFLSPNLWNFLTICKDENLAGRDREKCSYSVLYFLGSLYCCFLWHRSHQDYWRALSPPPTLTSCFPIKWGRIHFSLFWEHIKDIVFHSSFRQNKIPSFLWSSTLKNIWWGHYVNPFFILQLCLFSQYCSTGTRLNASHTLCNGVANPPPHHFSPSVNPLRPHYHWNLTIMF